MIRWISYTSRNIPGNQSFELGFHRNLAEAVQAYRDFCDGAGTDDCSMSLHFVAADEEQAMVSIAKEFEHVGCPFDYPAKVITRGARGGVRMENC